MVSRFLITSQQLLGLTFGGGFAYVNQKKQAGEGFTIFVILLRIILLFAWPFLDKNLIKQPFPVQFRIRLERLGPTYIKLGQILSLREDILPANITEELHNLLDRLPAVSFPRFKEMIEDNLVSPLGSVFRWIDPNPLGSASLAQTHRARLISHEKVVIKILKPGVRKIIQTDTKLMRIFGAILQIPLGRYQPKRVIDEFSAYTVREVDLTIEADNAEIFAGDFEHQPEIHFPKIYRKFSNKNMLIMEYFQGVKPEPKSIQHLSNSQRNHVVDLGISAILQMIFKYGFFHADLHPGNLIIFPDATVGFIDLGMVGRFDREMKKRLFYYFYSLVTENPENAARYLTSLASSGKSENIDNFKRAVSELYRKWLRTPNFYDFSLAQVILQSIVLAGHYHIRYPAEIILMVKALVTVEGVGNLIAPGIDIVAASRKHLRSLLLNEFNPLIWLRDSALIVPEMVEILNRSPLILSEGLQMLEGYLKRPQQSPLSGARATILAGFFILSGAVILALGSPWYIWTILFLVGIILALKR